MMPFLTWCLVPKCWSAHATPAMPRDLDQKGLACCSSQAISTSQRQPRPPRRSHRANPVVKNQVIFLLLTLVHDRVSLCDQRTWLEVAASWLRLSLCLPRPDPILRPTLSSLPNSAYPIPPSLTMAAAPMPSLPVHEGLIDAPLDKHDAASLPPPQVHTPPTTDEASHKDDDAASSSSLSDLGDYIEDEENRMRFEEAARAGAEAEQFSEVKPDRYENGVPIFTPVCETTPVANSFDPRYKRS